MRSKACGLRAVFVTAILLTLCSSAYSQIVSVNANLLDGTGATYRTGYLHFQLENCGANVPNMGATGSGNFIVQDSFEPPVTWLTKNRRFTH